MKVLFWAKSPCIRTYKEAAALKDHGLETALAWTGRPFEERYPGLDINEAFCHVVRQAGFVAWHYVEDYHIDVIHVAHPPDHPVRALKPCLVPIVHDVHDLVSLETDDAALVRYERDAVEHADGLVYVSELMRRYVGETHPQRCLDDAIVPNAAHKTDVHKIEKPWPTPEKHVVYSAAMPRWRAGHFRDLATTAEEITGLGVHLHVYALRAGKDLEDAAAHNPLLHLETGRSGRAMVSELSKFDAGIIHHKARTPAEEIHLDMASSNKLYEYWQAGIPVISRPHEEAARVIEEYRLGSIVDDFTGILPILERPYEPRRPVVTMTDVAGRLVELYERVIWR